MRLTAKVLVVLSTLGLILCLINDFSYSAQVKADYKKLKRGVVKIIVKKQGNEQETGTGIVIGIDGNIVFIITALHVVTFEKNDRRENAQSIDVVFYDKPYLKFKGRIFEKYHPDLDIAVIVVDPEKGKKIPSDLPAITIGDIAAIVEGKKVTAIGHPFDYDWEAQIDNNTIIGPSAMQDHRKFRLTQQGIEGGYSGGPIFNEQKQLIGMTTNIYQSYTIAVKMDEAVSVIKEWRIPTSKLISPPLTAQLSAPKAPTNLKAKLERQTKVRLEWTDNANNEKGFKIIRRGSNDKDFDKYATVTENKKYYVDEKANKPGTTYQYMIQAFNEAGESVPSNMASVTTPFSRPDAPTALKTRAVAPTQVRLEWKDRSDNERGFKIERKAGNESKFRMIDTVGQNKESYYDKHLRPGTNYEYRVRAFNNEGDSVLSSVVSIRMADPSWETASGFLSVAKSDIKHVDDISGLTICGSERSLKYLSESTGIKDFKAVTLPAGEYYPALEKGVCNSVVVYINDPKKLRDVYYRMRLKEVAPNLILLP